MTEYPINKGIGRQVEFQSLTAHYLFLLVGGLGGVFLTFVVLFIAGVPQGVCILFAVVAVALVVWGIFYLNRRFGPYGLIKQLALRQHPRRILHRRAIRYLLKS